MEKITQGDEAPAETAARRAKWAAGKPAQNAEAATPMADEFLAALQDALPQTATIADIKARRTP